MESKRLLAFGDFTYDPQARILLRGGQPADMPPRPAAIFHHLISNRDRVISKDELKSTFWKEPIVEDNAVERQIAIIRRVVGTDPGRIATKYKRGWQFVAEVREVAYAHGPVVQSTPAPSEVVFSAAPATVASNSRPGIPRLGSGLILLVGIALAGITAAGIWPREARIVTFNQLTNDGRLKSGPLLTDGSRLYFSEIRDGDYRLASVPLSGGYPAPVPGIKAGLQAVDISADGRLLLLGFARGAPPEQGTLWIYSPKDCSIRLFGKNLEAATWGPGKDSVTFSESKKVSIVGPDGHLVHLFDAPERVRELHWSPDAQHLRVWLINPGGEPSGVLDFDRHTKVLSQLAYLGNDQKSIENGVWSPDGKYFFYHVGIFPYRQLWVVREQGLRIGLRKPTQVTNGLGYWAWPAVTKADASLYSIHQELRSELVQYDVREKTWQTIWDGLPATELDFSRDGAWVAFVYQADHTVWKAKPDGSQRTQLTSPGLEAHQPHWSPDGRTIAFMGQNGKGAWHVFTVSSQGGPVQEVAPAEDDEGVPTWSADGRFIAFGERRSMRPLSQMSIHLVDRATKRVLELANSRGLWSPRWSPDGKYVLAVTTDNKCVRLFRTSDSSWTDLLHFGAVDNVMWSYDSNYIYFDGVPANVAGSQDMYRVSVPEGKLEKLVDMKDFVLAVENWYGVSPDGSLLAARGHISQEVFALKCQLP